MNDVELIKLEIDDLIFKLSSDRATGRTSRLVNDIVEQLFRHPVNTKINVIDHYHGRNIGYIDGKCIADTSHNVGTRKSSKIANKILLNKITKRLNTEYPNTKYEYSKAYPYWIMRTSKTCREIMQDELDELRLKLKEHEIRN